MKTKQIEIKDLLIVSLDEKKTLDTINRQLASIEKNLRPIKISVAVDGGTIDLGQVQRTFQNITDIAQNTSDEIVSLVESAVQKMGILQTQMANLQQMQREQGQGFSVGDYSNVIEVMANLASLTVSGIDLWKHFGSAASIALGAMQIKLTAVKIGLASLVGGLAVGAAMVGLEWLIGTFVKANKELDINTEALVESAQKNKDNADNLQLLLDRYRELSTETSEGTKKQAELQEVLEKIRKVYPPLVDATGKYGDQLSLNVGKTEQYIALLKEMNEEELIRAKTALDIELINSEQEEKELKEELEKIQGKFDEKSDFIFNFQAKFNTSGFDDTLKAVQKRVGEIALDDNIPNENMEIERIWNDFFKYESLLKSPTFNNYKVIQEKTNDAMANVVGIKERQSAINSLLNSVKGAIEENVGLSSALQEVDREVGLLARANKELINVNVLSIDTVTELSKKYGTDFIKELAKGESAVRSFLETKKDEAINSIKSDKTRTLSDLENSRTRVEAITKELRAIKERELAYASAMPTRDTQGHYDSNCHPSCCFIR